VLIDTFAQPTLTIHLEPPTLTRMTTPTPMDDDDDPCHDNRADNAACHHETQQPMDLLAIQ